MARVRIFTGLIALLPESGRPTGMYKTPVSAPIKLGFGGFDGDQQADRRVHGGPDKAVHLYPTSHYQSLATRFPQAADELVPGSFGENLATEDLDEHDVRVGDIWRLGDARLQICQPRNPCWKIDERFSIDGMAAFVDQHCRTGWYWRVIRPGTVSPDDELTLIAPGSFTLYEAMTLWLEHRPSLTELSRLAGTLGIAEGWRAKINQRLSYLQKTVAH